MDNRVKKVLATRKKIEVYFKDGSLLEFTTYRNDGEIRLDTVLLYKGGELKAKVVDKPPKEGFSSDDISQKEFAEYWNAALENADNRFENYRRGRISDEKWDSPQYLGFWIIANDGFLTRHALENGRKPRTEGLRNREKEDAETLKILKRYYPGVEI